MNLGSLNNVHNPLHHVPAMLQGIPASAGWAIANAYVLDVQPPTAVYYPIEPEDIDTEQALLSAAFHAVRTELTALALPLQPLASQGLAHQELYALLEVHLLMLDDPCLYAATQDYIASERVNAPWALSLQIQRLAASFEGLDDTYLSERALDVRQLGQQLLTHLLTPAHNALAFAALPANALEHPIILVAQDLAPAYFAQCPPERLAGLITELGGQSSHTAIVARSHRLPAVLGVAEALQSIQSGDMLAINGNTGQIWINPTPEHLAELRTQQRAWHTQTNIDQTQVKQAAITACGKLIRVLGNIEHPNDVAHVLKAHLDGVGLFRTEFLFMGRQTLPSEDEQTTAYQAVVQTLNGLPATIRTLDIGADKLLNAAHAHDLADSPNPALGLRAVRYCLANPEVFLTQLRALLRASRYGTIQLLLPMIASVDEVVRCRQYLVQAEQQLKNEGVLYGTLALGIMIEIPAAAIAIDTLLPYVDFCSIGTNDLIQYTLAIDRADATVSNLYNPAHPAIIALLRHVLQSCEAAGKSVSVCGEMAGDAHYTALLLDLGLRVFSLNHHQAASVKAAIRQWHQTS